MQLAKSATLVCPIKCNLMSSCSKIQTKLISLFTWNTTHLELEFLAFYKVFLLESYRLFRKK